MSLLCLYCEVIYCRFFLPIYSVNEPIQGYAHIHQGQRFRIPKSCSEIHLQELIFLLEHISTTIPIADSNETYCNLVRIVSIVVWSSYICGYVPENNKICLVYLNWRDAYKEGQEENLANWIAKFFDTHFKFMFEMMNHLNLEFWSSMSIFYFSRVFN